VCEVQNVKHEELHGLKISPHASRAGYDRLEMWLERMNLTWK